MSVLKLPCSACLVFLTVPKKLKNSFNRLLVVLALMDNLFIVLMIADYSLIRGLGKTHFQTYWKDTFLFMK